MCKSLTLIAVLLAIFVIPAYAQQSPMVQCRIGSFVEMMPDFACDGFTEGATKLLLNGRSSDGGDYTGIYHCAATAADYVGGQSRDLAHVCNLIWQAMIRDRATAGICPRCLVP
jgi:hypothetical protein